MKAVKRSAAVAVFHPRDSTRLLVVQRPADDEDLPNAWGLPAASLAPGESWRGAARRAGRDKLGIELRVEQELNRGETERAGYTLEMRLYIGRLVRGLPRVPQDVAGVTQYRDWRWDDAAVLRPAAAQGSLCCRLLLELPAD
jgi:ADP-ribose pyrophosphatase YjhB (NUDIX family)